jgi:hypothetical protein
LIGLDFGHRIIEKYRIKIEKDIEKPWLAVQSRAV